MLFAASQGLPVSPGGTSCAHAASTGQHVHLAPAPATWRPLTGKPGQDSFSSCLTPVLLLDGPWTCPPCSPPGSQSPRGHHPQLHGHPARARRYSLGVLESHGGTWALSCCAHAISSPPAPSSWDGLLPQPRVTHRAASPPVPVALVGGPSSPLLCLGSCCSEVSR